MVRELWLLKARMHFLATPEAGRVRELGNQHVRARRRSHYRSLRRLPCPTDESWRPLEAGQAVQNQLAELRIQERVEHRIRDAGQHGEAEKAQGLAAVLDRENSYVSARCEGVRL